MVLKYPGAKWEPLGVQTEPRMKSHDILCFHTMVGSLAGTSNMFHQNGYGGTESHFGMGESKAQGIEQWQDLMYQADANVDGGHRVVSIETADYGGVFGTWNTRDPSQVPAWTSDQLDMLVAMTVWFCRKSTHANCPSTWNCHKYGVPCVLIPDSKPGRRGMGYHRQGCDPYRVDGGERWSTAYGKVCPAPKRISQLANIIIPRAQKILAGAITPPKDWFDMATEATLEAVLKRIVPGIVRSEVRAYFRDELYNLEANGTAAKNHEEVERLLRGLPDEVATKVWWRWSGMRDANGEEIPLWLILRALADDEEKIIAKVEELQPIKPMTDGEEPPKA